MPPSPRPMRSSGAAANSIDCAKNLAFIRDLRQAGEIRLLEFSMVVQTRNFREMPAFVRLGQEFSADIVSFQMIRNWGTFSAAEFKEEFIGDPAHPRHRELIEVLRAPEMAHEIARAGNIWEYVRRRRGGVKARQAWPKSKFRQAHNSNKKRETYIGKPDSVFVSGKGWQNKRGTATKRKVLTMVERGGRAVSVKVDDLTIPTFKRILGAHVVLDSTLNTDEAQWYKAPGKNFAKHEAVNHGDGEYARGDTTDKHRRGLSSAFSNVG